LHLNGNKNIFELEKRVIWYTITMTENPLLPLASNKDTSEYLMPLYSA
jgi:hypothetical protein